MLYRLSPQGFLKASCLSTRQVTICMSVLSKEARSSRHGITENDIPLLDNSS
ncbi:hypothetical protein SCLCIDRAFT_1222915 [Scleroderma citrinum Foug A]|uniref:Uncharacterized protein n=1 Tax=Scleroderma citrinum Foug A TaxID=1036808 RepID=A0A0C3CXR5_9AGAM|nr:hypothetical protein SCLCIDRAFT_1222915 [Scleroderma citrinum Foug A]